MDGVSHFTSSHYTQPTGSLVDGLPPRFRSFSVVLSLVLRPTHLPSPSTSPEVDRETLNFLETKSLNSYLSYNGEDRDPENRRPKTGRQETVGLSGELLLLDWVLLVLAPCVHLEPNRRRLHLKRKSDMFVNQDFRGLFLQ